MTRNISRRVLGWISKEINDLSSHDSVGKTYFPSGDSMVILRHHGKKEHQKHCKITANDFYSQGDLFL